MIDNKIRTGQKIKKRFNMGKTEGEMKAFLGILIAMDVTKNEKGVTFRQDYQATKLKAIVKKTRQASYWCEACKVLVCVEDCYDKQRQTSFSKKSN